MALGTLRQFLAGLCASIAIFCGSTSYAWTGPLLLRFIDPVNSPVPMSSDQMSWMVAILELGNVFTPIPSGIIVNLIGRKLLLLITGPCFLLSWILVLTTRSFAVLCIVRLIQGMSIGLVFTGLPMYLAEVAEPKLRGAICTFVAAMWNLGILYQYALGPFLSYEAFTWFSLGPTLIFLLAYIWFPESPYYLLLRGKRLAAMKSLIWFRCGEDPEVVKEELNAMMRSVQKEKEEKASWRDLWATRAGRKGLAILQLLAALKIMTGAYVLQSYASETLARVAGGSMIGPATGSVIMCTLTLIVTLLSGALVDRSGRRPLLMISAFGTALCSFSSCAYYYLLSETTVDISSLGWMPYTSVILSSSFVSLGIGTIGITMRAELIPTTIRGLATGITSTNLTLLSFVTLKLHQIIADSVGIYLDFFIYTVIGLLGIIGIYFFVPETKGKTFEEIQEELK